MLTQAEATFIGLCLEGFFYGLYSGLFALYLQLQMNKPRTAFIFCALCILYALSTVNVVLDLVGNTVERHFGLEQLIEEQLFTIRMSIAQITVGGCCDFLAQCILIYRCWIVWDQTILVVIVPLFLAVAFLATYVSLNGVTTFIQNELVNAGWGNAVTITSFTLSMAVNTLVTGLIVFKILKVFLEVKAATTSVERILGTTGGTKLRHVIFIIIESGMALLAVQLVRFVLFNLPVNLQSEPVYNAYVMIIGVNEMFNGITPTIILLRVSMKLSFDNKESFIEAAGSLRFNNPPTVSLTSARENPE